MCDLVLYISNLQMALTKSKQIVNRHAKQVFPPPPPPHECSGIQCLEHGNYWLQEKLPALQECDVRYTDAWQPRSTSDGAATVQYTMPHLRAQTIRQRQIPTSESSARIQRRVVHLTRVTSFCLCGLLAIVSTWQKNIYQLYSYSYFCIYRQLCVCF